jgi:hypothetical protein
MPFYPFAPQSSSGSGYPAEPVVSGTPVAGQVLTAETATTATWENSAAGFANPMTTAGDLIDGAAGGAAQRLAIGSANQVLTVIAGTPSWQNPAAGFTNPMTTAGDLIDGAAGGAAQRLGIGTTGQGLLVAGGAPAWANTVNSVAAGDGSIVVAGTALAPTLETGTLDVIAAAHPPAANWSNNSKNINNVADAVSAHQAAAFDQTIIGGALLTTAGDMIYENATPTVARLPVGTAGQSIQAVSGLPAWAAALTLLATTGTGGYALVNGTGNVISWTAPNDGNLHRIQVFATLHITTTEVGGAIRVNFTDPAGGSGTPTIFGGTQANGTYQPSSLSSVLVEAGTTVAIVQASALTSGAATLYAEIWGS